MSFDANIGRPQPAIKPASSMNNDGGSGGNTGYMMRGRKKDKKNSLNIFGSDTVSEIDSFELSCGLPKKITMPEETKKSWFNNLLDNFIK